MRFIGSFMGAIGQLGLCHHLISLGAIFAGKYFDSARKKLLI